MNLVGEYEALRSLEIQRLSPVESCTAGDLVFLAQASYLAQVDSARPAAFVVSEALWPQLAEKKLAAPVLRSRDAMLAFAKVSRVFASEGPALAGKHPTAVVHNSALVAETASLGAYVVVEEGAVIEAGAVLHAGVKVGPRSRIGRDTVLFPNVTIYQDVTLGERVRIHANTVIGADGFGYVQERVPGGVKHVKIHHLGGVIIGDDTEIGASSSVDRGTLGNTVIGKGCIIDNQVQIGHNVQMEDGVIVCGCSGLAGSSYVEKFAVIAGFVGVGNKVRIGMGAQVAAMSAVSTSVPAGAKWGGVPAMNRRDYAKLWAYIGRLPELFEERKKKNGNA